jgi:hypothetical protein
VEEVEKNKVLIEELEILMEEVEKNKYYYLHLFFSTSSIRISNSSINTLFLSTSSTRISIYSSLLHPQESLFTLLYFLHNNLYLFFSTSSTRISEEVERNKQRFLWRK